MNETNYTINLKDLSIWESRHFPESFDEYKETAKFLLRAKNIVILEDELIELYKDNEDVQEYIKMGNIPIGAIEATFPNRFIRHTIYPKAGGAEDEGVWGWFDLWSDYVIVPQDVLYTIFFAYKLRYVDLLEIDNFLNYTLENAYNDNLKYFARFLTLTIREEHGKKLLRPEQVETVQEWIAGKEKEATLSGTLAAIKTTGKPKRVRDDKVTSLNQEQIALLIYCLRETNIIFPEDFLTNKEAGYAFSILTGYSADTIRQNLNKSEVARLATIKNIDAVTKAMNDILKFIENEVKPEG